MKFDGIKLGYEREMLAGFTIEELTQKRTDKFNVSGLDDLVETMLVIEEFYSNHPVLTWKEASVGEVDVVFLESQNKAYSRLVEFPVFVKQETPRNNREAWGESIVRPTTAHLAVITLIRADYLPTAGDVFKFLNQWLEVTRVYVDPVDYYQTTGFPLYIRCDTRVANVDSRNLGQVCGKDDRGLTDLGSSSQQAPMDSLSELVLTQEQLPELIV